MTRKLDETILLLRREREIKRVTQDQGLDRKDLKVQALLEKVSSLTTQYENQIADLRVDLTLVTAELEALKEYQESQSQVLPDATLPDFGEGPSVLEEKPEEKSGTEEN